ncbi:hypothetical protein Holit_03172 [Hollandina sp. SP2]
MGAAAQTAGLTRRPLFFATDTAKAPAIRACCYSAAAAGLAWTISAANLTGLRHVAVAFAFRTRADGKTLESISKLLDVSLSSVIRYVTRFNSDGLESLLKDKTRKPGKAPVSVETKHQICAIVCKEKPKDAPHGSVRSLAKRVGVSKSRVNHIGSGE